MIHCTEALQGLQRPSKRTRELGWGLGWELGCGLGSGAGMEHPWSRGGSGGLGLNEGVCEAADLASFATCPSYGRSLDALAERAMQRIELLCEAR